MGILKRVHSKRLFAVPSYGDIETDTMRITVKNALKIKKNKNKIKIMAREREHVLAHYEIYSADSKYASMYHCAPVVFVTNQGTYWNLGNLGAAMWNSMDALHASWGQCHPTLTTYCRSNGINRVTNLWVTWPVLLEMLLSSNPTYTDHRLTWWCGLEVGMRI